jgi:hypothetical protein
MMQIVMGEIYAVILEPGRVGECGADPLERGIPPPRMDVQLHRHDLAAALFYSAQRYPLGSRSHVWIGVRAISAACNGAT